MDYLPANAVQRQLARLTPQELTDRLHAVRALSTVRGLRFLDERSRPRTIDVAAVPWIMTPPQLSFFRRVAQIMAGALTRLPALYHSSATVRQILPLDPVQQAWIRLEPVNRSNVLGVVGRLDATVHYASANWRKSFRLLEPNTVGVGGVHYAPTACSVILDVFGDVLKRAVPGQTVAAMPDPRRMLLDEASRLAAKLGRKLRGLALLENTDYTTGTDEFQQLARYFRQQGLKAAVVDPRRLRRAGRTILADGFEVDLLYRDCELNEFIEMESAGHRLTALRQAIRQGRLLSGLSWEFDHKSCWEIFTDPQLWRHFSPEQRRLFRAHLPWTRLVREAPVADRDGRRVDLVSYVRRHKDQLVLKPNTLYGGQGVLIGRYVSQADWERKLSQAINGRTHYVVQELATLGTEEFPILDHGHRHVAELRAISGFFFNSSDVGLVGRFSHDPVVNVSRGGGLLSALMIQ